MNTQVIIYLLLLSATVFRLFYEPYYGTLRDRLAERGRRGRLSSILDGTRQQQQQPPPPKRTHRGLDVDVPFTAGWKNCSSLNGFRCEDPGCDCERICGNSFFERIHVHEDDDAGTIVFDRKLTPGTYCLPRGSVRCRSQSFVTIFSSSGWSCQPRPFWDGNYRTACKSSVAADNSLNLLIDRSNNSIVGDDDDVNFYENLQDGSPRYRCRCGSYDDRGHKMISVIPFVCSQDYCIRDLRDRSALGWDGHRCECGPFPHLDPGDLASPCVTEASYYDYRHGILHGRVRCLTPESTEDDIHIYCPEGGRSLRFEKYVNRDSGDPLDFVRTFLNRIEKNTFKNNTE